MNCTRSKKTFCICCSTADFHSNIPALQIIYIMHSTVVRTPSPTGGKRKPKYNYITTIYYLSDTSCIRKYADFTTSLKIISRSKERLKTKKIPKYQNLTTHTHTHTDTHRNGPQTKYQSFTPLCRWVGVLLIIITA